LNNKSGYRRFTSPQDAWAFVSGLHRQNISYNLVVVPGYIYCLPRRRQGSYRHADWHSGYAWYEMAGGVMTVRRQDYEALHSDLITRELELLMLRDWGCE
ncbi:MAG: hypothetical protein P8Z39_02165, partial [Gammaproteobacteria bacterium]